MQQKQVFANDLTSEPKKEKSKKTTQLIILAKILIAVGIISSFILIKNKIKTDQETQQEIEKQTQLNRSEGISPEYLTEESKNIIPDFDFFISYMMHPVTQEYMIATIVSRLENISGREITLYNQSGENYQYDLSEQTEFYQFNEGDKENFFPAQFEDLKIGNIITYYVSREEQGRVGKIYIRIEK
jgi:hypothetical protein